MQAAECIYAGRLAMNEDESAARQPDKLRVTCRRRVPKVIVVAGKIVRSAFVAVTFSSAIEGTHGGRRVIVAEVVAVDGLSVSEALLGHCFAAHLPHVGVVIGLEPTS